MKKLLLILTFTFLLFSCKEDEINDNGFSPIISDPLISISYERLLEQMKITTFYLGDDVWFAFKATDNDMDIDHAILTQTSSKMTIGPDKMQLPKQTNGTVYYFGKIKAEYLGDWSVSLYVVDSKGNKSNLLTEQIEVKGKIKILYDLNGGSGTAPIDNNEYKMYDRVYVAGSSDMHREGYIFSNWNTAPDPSNGLYVSYNFDITEQHIARGSDQIILYAVWNKSISDISYTISNEQVNLTWNDPVSYAFDYIILEIYYKLPNGELIEIKKVYNIRKGDMKYSFYPPVESKNYPIYLKMYTYIYTSGLKDDDAVYYQFDNQINYIPPQDVSNVTWNRDNYGYFRISWTIPNDDDFSHVRIELFFNNPNVNPRIYNIGKEETSAWLTDTSATSMIIKAVDYSGNTSNGLTYYF